MVNLRICLATILQLILLFYLLSCKLFCQVLLLCHQLFAQLGQVYIKLFFSFIFFSVAKEISIV